MTDKFRKVIPLRITLADGERPSGAKFNAISEQVRNGTAILEKAIGDPWTQSGDSLYTSIPLQIPNLARLIGQNKFLNPAIFPVNSTFTYEDEAGNRFLGKNEGYLLLPTDDVTSLTLVGGDAFTTRVASEDLVDAAGEYWVDSTTGKFKTYYPVSGADAVSYTVDPTAWALGDNTLPSVIPDPRQTIAFTACRISDSGGKYYLHLPPRMPLTLGSTETPHRYPVSGIAGVVDNMDTSTVSDSTRKFYQYTTSGLSGTGADFYRYSLPREIVSGFSSGALSEGDKIPEGAMYIFHQTDGSVIEDVVFRRAPASMGDWVVEVESSTFDFSTVTTATDEETNYNSNLSLITNGSSLAANLYTLWNTALDHEHNGAGYLDNVVSHDDLVDNNPPVSGYAGHGTRYPSYAPSWLPSRWAHDQHTSLLNRLGSQASGAERDPNNNAMLGDLVLANSVATAGVFLDGTTPDDSFRLRFGDTDGPYLFAPSGTANGDPYLSVGHISNGLTKTVTLQVSGVENGNNSGTIAVRGVGGNASSAQNAGWGYSGLGGNASGTGQGGFGVGGQGGSSTSGEGGRGGWFVGGTGGGGGGVGAMMAGGGAASAAWLVSGSEPTESLQAGCLYVDDSKGNLHAYNGGAWSRVDNYEYSLTSLLQPVGDQTAYALHTIPSGIIFDGTFIDVVIGIRVGVAGSGGANMTLYLGGQSIGTIAASAGGSPVAIGDDFTIRAQATIQSKAASGAMGYVGTGTYTDNSGVYTNSQQVTYTNRYSSVDTSGNLALTIDLVDAGGTSIRWDINHLTVRVYR